MKLPTPAPTRRLRTSRRCRTALLFFIAFTLQLLASHRHTFAQQDQPPDSSEEIVRVRTDLVVVPIFVTDGRDRRVSGLTQTDFELRDNGRLIEPTYFAAGAESVALLFLLDASGSTRDIITQQRETALALFSHFGARSRVAVMQFRERPELTLRFTADLRRAPTAFQIKALPDHRTAIFDAALAAVRAYHSEGQHPTERRIIILFSDGLDTASAVPPASVIEEARAAGVSFYVIHIPLYEPRDGHLTARRPSKGFKELAEKTGGQLFIVGDARSSLDPRAEHDLRPIFNAIAEDLQSQYVIGYHASAASHEPGLHRIDVRLSAPHNRKLRVRQLREGYENKNSDK
jgi:Ca-activated chloride channel family protein